MGVTDTHCCLILGGFWNSRAVTWSQYRPRALENKSHNARFNTSSLLRAVTPMGVGYTHGCRVTPMGVKLQENLEVCDFETHCADFWPGYIVSVRSGSNPVAADQLCEIRPHPLLDCLWPGTLRSNDELVSIQLPYTITPVMSGK